MLAVGAGPTKLLNENIELYRGLIEHLPDGVILHRQRRILFANRAAARFLGASSPAEFEGRDILDIVHADARAGVIAAMRQTALDSQAGFLAQKLVRFDGAVVWADVRVIATTFDSERMTIVVMRDATERRRAEQALRESEALHRLLFDAAPQGIVVTQDDVVVLANSIAARIHGFESPQQFIGKAPHAFIHPDDLARVPQRGATVMAAGTENQVQDAQLRIVRSDGTICHVMTGAKRFAYRGAPALHIHQIDVTEQVKAREEKQALETQLRRAEKMKSVGTLADGIAHEFNNLLVPIIGLTELVIDSLPDGDATAAMLKQVLSAAQRSRELIKRIHTFGHSERASDTLKTALLQDLIGATIDVVRPSVPAGIRIKYHADPSCGPVAIEDVQLKRILVKLCSNASDAIGASAGEISIEVRPAHLGNPRAAGLQALRQGDYVVLSVRDTGCGMDAATMERIFEPFFTTKEVGRGTGLGLAVIHGLISARGGGITVSSEPGKGSEFRLYLPVVSVQSETTPFIAAQAIG